MKDKPDRVMRQKGRFRIWRETSVGDSFYRLECKELATGAFFTVESYDFYRSACLLMDYYCEGDGFIRRPALAIARLQCLAAKRSGK
jgi:hypothetical protein